MGGALLYGTSEDEYAVQQLNGAKSANHLNE